jgi:hypothetical protein
MTSGRAARSDQRHQHVAPVVHAQHGVAQIAGQRALVVGDHTRAREHVAQHDRDVVERRLGDPAAAHQIDHGVRARRVRAQRQRAAAIARARQLRSIAVAQRAWRGHAVGDRHPA